MNIRNGIVDAIGNTPLIRLKRASELTGCDILGKAEFMNPGQSVKDRAALFIIRDADRARRAAARRRHRRGHGRQYRHRPGAGRQRAGLPHRHRHPRDPEPGEEGRAPPARRRAGRGAGRALREPEQLREALRPAGRASWRSTEPNGAIWANQFDNVANRQAHIETHRPGDLGADRRQGRRLRLRGRHRRHAGRRRASALKAAQPERRRSALADPLGAALYSFYTDGELKSEGTSITEGIGQGRITAQSRRRAVDVAFQIPDEEALPIVFDLLEHEGLCLGGSTGINVAGAIRLARELGPGHTIVTILCDYGTRYQSKLFNPDFLRSKGLPVPAWLERRATVKPPLE